MEIWSDDYLLYLKKQGEIELSHDVHSIFHRFSLAITSGTHTYSLPTGILSIIQITYKGRIVNPFSHQVADAAGFGIKLQSQSTGDPFYYIQLGYGMDQIRFYPTPTENVGADDTGIWGSDIGNRVVFSVWRVADPDGDTYRLPDFMRRRINKYYVNMRAYLKEGKGQQIQASEYFKKRYYDSKQHLQKVADSIPKAITFGMKPMTSRLPGPARPVLPVNFGVIVE